VLVDETLTLLAGHGRVKAAESINLTEIPAVQLLGLTEAQKRALALADNKIGDNAGWDGERLAIELPELAELLFKEKLDISLTGFSPAEIDQLLIDFEEDSANPDDEIDRAWQTGPWSANQVVCGSWISIAFYARTRGAEPIWIA
jgi:ParB-like chromosome segregation protein Spo0J